MNNKMVFINDRIPKKKQLIDDLNSMKKSYEQLMNLSGNLLYAGNVQSTCYIEEFLNGNMDLKTMYDRIQKAQKHSFMNNPKFKKELFKLIEKYSEDKNENIHA